MSFCPVTGQPDFNKVIIEYAPDKLCVESKSLKLYLWTFRESYIFGEGLANEIAKNIFEAVMPRWCKITIIHTTRRLDLLCFVYRNNLFSKLHDW
ncbi:MAG: preQ(1) synthase [Anaerolineaceae bacterium 4572_78]|nr:MAG: preQ(1) synthase [Anaerolineaceae bacterium 4572_78]